MLGMVLAGAGGFHLPQRGVARHHLNAMMVQTVTATAAVALEGETCQICLDGFPEKSEVMRPPCLHKFHADCIREWFQKSNICPVCREDVNVMCRRNQAAMHEHDGD
jgi:hypothetical protein